MTQGMETNKPKDRSRISLARGAFWPYFLAVTIPALSLVLGITFLPVLFHPGSGFILFLIYIVIGILSALFLKWLFIKRVVKPIRNLADATSSYSEGEIARRENIQRRDEIGLLADSINKILEKTNPRSRELETAIKTQAQPLRTAAELAELFTTSTDLSQLIQKTVDTIVKDFGYNHAAIFLADGLSNQLQIKAIAGDAASAETFHDYSIKIKPDSFIGWVAENNQLRIAGDVAQDPLFHPFPNLKGIRSEIALPICTQGDVLGVIDVQTAAPEGFSGEEITILKMIAHQMSPTIQYFLFLKVAAANPVSDSLFYQASHIIATARDSDEIFKALKKTLQRLPFAAALYVAEPQAFIRYYVTDKDGREDNQLLSTIQVSPFVVAESIPESSILTTPISGGAEDFPVPLKTAREMLDYRSLTLYLIPAQSSLAGLLFLGATMQGSLATTEISNIRNLVDIAATSLEKIRLLHTTSGLLTELETINTVSESISTETNLELLYQVIHQQIIQVMGPVNFYIAHYSEEMGSIEIPYMDDGNGIISIPPFPLGNGLTSIIIRTRQPLMIVEDTINRSRALGAIITGEKPALSWLGVPMILGGEIIGAIVVQDLEKENRFDEDDMRLLTTLAAQVGVAVRNTRLIETSQKRSRRDRQLFEITSKIRHAVDIESILTTTTEELSKALDAKRAHIEITLDPSSISPNGISNPDPNEVAE